jgi:hypothetical protein
VSKKQHTLAVAQRVFGPVGGIRSKLLTLAFLIFLGLKKNIRRRSVRVLRLYRRFILTNNKKY